MNLNNIERYWKNILDQWLKKKSLSFVEARKNDGAILNEREEHISRRSFEAGILKGLQLSVELQPKYKDFLVRMVKDMNENIKVE